MKLDNFLENKIISFVGILAIVLGTFTVAIDSQIVNWLITIMLFGAIVSAWIYEYIKSKKLSSMQIHIPIVIKIDDGPDVEYAMDELINSIEKKYNLKDYKSVLQKYFSINYKRLVFEEKYDIENFDRLMSFARIIHYNIQQLETMLAQPIKLHIAFYRRPAFGFLIGTMFRTNNLAIYQNNDFKNCFECVADIKNRKYKERIAFENFTKYSIKMSLEDDQSDMVLVVINSASHSVNTEDKKLKIYKNRTIVSLKENGTIPYENDWICYAQEIYNVFNCLQANGKKMIVAHAMPEALSVMLGMGLENYWDIKITQYIDGTYQEVFSMKDIRYYH